MASINVNGDNGQLGDYHDIPDLQEPSGQVTNLDYEPVKYHWFYNNQKENRENWCPFCKNDSEELEIAFQSDNPERVVATDGGRFDVNISRRERLSVYWTSEPTAVRRCSWFRKNTTDGRYIPYDEDDAAKLEEEYKNTFITGNWNHKVALPNGETVVFHGPDVLVLFPQTQGPDAWGNTPQTQPRPRIVKRGVEDFDIGPGEPKKVDHLLFLVHGIGSVCDLKFRTVEEVVDEFRSVSLQLVQSHYKTSCENGLANRVEVLPISWHQRLHSDETGIDKQLESITLESIPRLRVFTNDTLLDILFYTSPVYCQTIIHTVGNEMNRLYDLFRARNPTFTGDVYLGGHSLGSLIVFDILCHQHPASNNENDEDIPQVKITKPHPSKRKMCKRISYMMSNIGTGQAEIHYPHLNFYPKTFFALGSPIGMFVTVRGLDTLGEQFALPTCPGFFNIFHPYDPVAYRVESLVSPELAKLKPVLIPHHKGRKRMHLELKETMARVGADLKQRVVDSMKSTWNSLYQIGLFNKQTTPNIEAEVQNVIKAELEKEQESQQLECDEPPLDMQETHASLGLLNRGRRIDYVLQEAPFEFFNEYIFALTSHVCYWESEDTMLLMLKEIYGSMGLTTDNRVPQQTMTIERPSSLSPSPTRFK